MSSLKFLLRQGLAISGHMEADGDLLQLMELWSEDFPDLKRWLGDHNCLSYEIVNEMIRIMGTTLLHKLLVNIRESS